MPGVFDSIEDSDFASDEDEYLRSVLTKKKIAKKKRHKTRQAAKDLKAVADLRKQLLGELRRAGQYVRLTDASKPTLHTVHSLLLQHAKAAYIDWAESVFEQDMLPAHIVALQDLCVQAKVHLPQ